MSDITRETTASKVPESYSDALVKDAYNFYTDTIAHPDARARQAFVAATGAVVGGIKDIPNEFCHHAHETSNKIAVDVTVGAGAATLLTAESPLIVGGTLVGGAILMAHTLKNSWEKACNNSELSQALSATWKSNDPATMLNSIKIAEKQLGREAFDYELAAIAGGIGAKSAPSLDEIANILPPK
jgi:hypothetical protein